MPSPLPVAEERRSSASISSPSSHVIPSLSEAVASSSGEEMSAKQTTKRRRDSSSPPSKDRLSPKRHHQDKQQQISHQSGFETRSLDLSPPSAKLSPPAKPTVIVTTIPTKGHGLITSRHIKRGTLLVHECPLFEINNHPSLSSVQRARGLYTTLSELSGRKLTSFFRLHNSFEDQGKEETMLQEAIGIVRTNCLPLCEQVGVFLGEDGGEGETLTRLGVFATISRTNHSCCPNAEFSWQGEKGVGRLYAVREIGEGEEVTIDYVGQGEAGNREAYLKEGFGFVCVCGICEGGEKGKTFLREFSRLESRILVLSGSIEVMALVRDALALLDMLGIRDMRVTRLDGHALQVALQVANLDAAQLFAQLYWRSCTDCLGADHRETKEARDMLAELMEL